MAQIGPRSSRLAQIGLWSSRLAQIDPDWPRKLHIGPDWPRLASGAAGWPPRRPDWFGLLQEAQIGSNWPQKGPDWPQEVHIHIHIQVHVHIHTHVHTHTQIQIHVQMQTHTNIHLLFFFTRIPKSPILARLMPPRNNLGLFPGRTRWTSAWEASEGPAHTPRLLAMLYINNLGRCTACEFNS